MPETESKEIQSPLVKFLFKILSWKLSVIDVIALIPTIYLILIFQTRRHWVVDVFANLSHWILLVSFVIFLALLVFRKWRNAAYWAIPSLAFLIMFGGLFLPNFRSSHRCDPADNPSCVHLRVMTFNTFSFTAKDYKTQIELIRESGADIVAMQEVSSASVSVYDTELADIYPYRLLHRGLMAGKGILSKYPFLDLDLVSLSTGGLYYKSVVLDVKGTPVTIFNAHFPEQLSPRKKGLSREKILTLAGHIPTNIPVILMGDFNITDQAEDYRTLVKSGLKDSFREAGWGFGLTWPTRLMEFERTMPLVRIDYIWHSDDFAVESVRVGRKTQSDHLPVIADLILDVE